MHNRPTERTRGVLRRIIPPVQKPTAPPPKTTPINRDAVGICVTAGHLVEGDAARYAAMLAGSGAGWGRIYIAWMWVERQPGKYTWDYIDKMVAACGKTGLKYVCTIARPPTWYAPTPGLPLYPSAYAAYFRFVRELVLRYGDVIAAWEIENEPDGTDPDAWQSGLSCWSGDPAAYVRLLQTAQGAIQSTGKEAYILMGGMAHEDIPGHFDINFLGKVIGLGGCQHVDALDFHYYPIFAPRWNNERYTDIAAKAQAVRAMSAQFGLPIWCTEVGLAGVPGDEKSLLAQAAYVKAVYVNGFQNGDLAKIFWFAFFDSFGGSNADLIYADYSPKPAYYSFQNLTRRYTTYLPIVNK